MPQPITDNCRDVGLAEQRYLKPEELPRRVEVAKRIREIANSISPDNQPPEEKKRSKLKLKLRRQADRYESCRTMYSKIACRACGQTYLGPRRCESRICDSCSHKYSVRIRKNKMGIVKRLQRTKYNRLMFLTLTKRVDKDHNPDSSDIKQLFKHARKLINALWPKKLGCGAFAVFEIGKNHNLHIHVIVYGHYVPQAQISRLWLEMTGDSPIVHIAEVRGAYKCINYLLKYLTKSRQNDDPENLVDYLVMIMGIRRIHTYGIFYNYPLAKKDASSCLLCGGKLQFCKFDRSSRFPQGVLLFEEAMKLVGTKAN